MKDSGGPVDAGGDAGPDADESGNVTVATKSAHFGQTIGAALGDVDIVSNLPNGAVFASGKTDAGGGGTIKAVPGGSITAFYKRPTDMGYEIVSFVGVKPGETLEFGNRQPSFFCPPAPAPCDVSQGLVQYNWTVQGGATQTRILAGCASTSVAAPTATISIDERPSCGHNPIDAVFVSITNTAVTGCTTRQNQPFPGPVTVGTPSAAPFAVIANITGIPSEVTQVSTQFSPVLNTQLERNANFVTGFARSNGVNSGGAFTGNFQYCGMGKRTSATLSLSRPGFANTRVIDSLPSNATSWTVSNPMLPPFLEANGFIQSPSQRRAEWVLSPSAGTTHDAVTATFAWSVVVGGMNSTVFWHFVLPPGTTEVTLPKVPAALEPYMPTTETGFGLQFLRLVEIPTVANYDAFRALGAGAALCPECMARTGDIQRVIVSGF